MTESEWLLNQELPLRIWNKKYRKDESETFEDWLTRVSGGDEEVKQLIREKKFLFAGRILSNRGITDRKGTLSNCYVLPQPEDNLESIFKTASDMARTFSYGGGVGIDLSNLRPSGARVNNAALTTSGPVGFMELYSQTTNTIAQNGRRGALMLSMDINHPDIEAFIDIKTDLSKVNYANISVRVNDDFMIAVEEDKDYILRWPCDHEIDVHNEQYSYNELYTLNDKVYIKKIKARDLFNKLVKNNWDYAEPGILYWDRVCNHNLLSNTNIKPSGVNPCAEEPLLAGGSCLLGSINLSEFVVEPFVQNHARIDYTELSKAVDICVRALNDVLDEGLPLHPLLIQRETVRDYRQIGLGTMGLADALIKLGITYGSQKSLDVIEEIYSNIAIQAVETSLALAKESNCYPKCDKEKLVESSFISSLGLSSSTLEDIKKYGLRNSQLLTCAPTGSISTMIETSGGVEPVFAMHYTRTTKSLEGKDKTFEVYTNIAQQWLNKHPGQKLPEYFIESGQVNPSDRVKVQGILQQYIDASISSTVNLPEEATVNDVYNIYVDAWKHGLKGITIFRQNCKRIAILNVNPIKEEEKVKFDSIVPVSRKQLGTTCGSTFCKKCACGTLYVTVNRDKDGNFVELFTHTSKGGICQANLNAVTRGISLALRSGIKIDEITDQLKGIHCPACANAKAKGIKIDGLSCPDIMGRVMDEFAKTKVTNEQIEQIPVEQPNVDGELCPECHHTLRHDGGCVQCVNCGWSKCS